MNLDEKRLVIARMQALRPKLRLSMGTFYGGKKERIKEIENETEVGQRIVNATMEYLRNLKYIFAKKVD